MLGADLFHQLVGHAQTAVGGGQGADELLNGVDKGGQRGGGVQTQVVAGLHHGGGGNDAAVDDRGGGQGEFLANQGNCHGAAQNGGGHADDSAEHGTPLSLQGVDINGCAHVEEEEILAQLGQTGETGNLHNVGRIDAGQEQDQEAHHDDEHGGDLGLGQGAHKIAHEENEQYGEYCLIYSHFHIILPPNFCYTQIYLDPQRSAKVSMSS